MRVLTNPTPDFVTTYFPIIIATITGLVGMGLGIYNFIQGQKDRKPKFEEFKRKKDNARGRWFIYIHSPSKPVRGCECFFKGVKLSLRGETGYKKTIVSGGGCNFDMPKDVTEDDDGKIIIKSGRWTILEKSKFNEMETEIG